MWLQEFKVALIRKDAETIGTLLDSMPQLQGEELEEAGCLLRQARELLQTEQSRTRNKMQQLRKNVDFLKSTQSETPKKLDITS